MTGESGANAAVTAAFAPAVVTEPGGDLAGDASATFSRDRAGRFMTEATAVSSTVASPALVAVLAVLEAERLAPVPRATHAVAVDVDDLALVAAYAADAAAAAAAGRRPGAMSADTAVAWQRLDAVVRGRARSAA